MLRFRYLVLGVVAATGLVACGASSSQPSVTTTTASQPSGGATPANSGGQAKSFPAPCSLLTTADVQPLFGAAAITATATTGPATGTAQCAFSLTVGSQGKSVSIKTRNSYANDPSYVFPSAPTKVAGIGDAAVVETTNTREGTITVKMGKNAIQITVDFYDQPVDNAFLTRPARDAVARA
jgi:hypothetical protein